MKTTKQYILNKVRNNTSENAALFLIKVEDKQSYEKILNTSIEKNWIQPIIKLVPFVDELSDESFEKLIKHINHFGFLIPAGRIIEHISDERMNKYFEIVFNLVVRIVQTPHVLIHIIDRNKLTSKQYDYIAANLKTIDMDYRTDITEILAKQSEKLSENGFRDLLNGIFFQYSLSQIKKLPSLISYIMESPKFTEEIAKEYIENIIIAFNKLLPMQIPYKEDGVFLLRKNIITHCNSVLQNLSSLQGGKYLDFVLNEIEKIQNEKILYKVFFQTDNSLHLKTIRKCLEIADRQNWKSIVTVIIKHYLVGTIVEDLILKIVNKKTDAMWKMIYYEIPNSHKDFIEKFEQIADEKGWQLRK